MEGYLWKGSGFPRNVKFDKRWVVVSSTVRYYLDETCAKLRGEISGEILSVEPAAKKRFVVKTRDRDWIFAVDDLADKEKWIASIRTLMKSECWLWVREKDGWTQKFVEIGDATLRIDNLEVPLWSLRAEKAHESGFLAEKGLAGFRVKADDRDIEFACSPIDRDKWLQNLATVSCECYVERHGRCGTCGVPRDRHFKAMMRSTAKIRLGPDSEKDQGDVEFVEKTIFDIGRLRT